MLKIRFQRFGKNKTPMYRIAVLEKSSKRDGEPVEILGFYNPKSKELVLNTERAKYWQSVGAQASDSVKTILKRDPLHDLVNGPYVYKAKTRADKIKTKTELLTKSTKNTKAKKKKATAATLEATANTEAADQTPSEEAAAT